jgi:hypothetical protein
MLTKTRFQPSSIYKLCLLALTISTLLFNWNSKTSLLTDIQGSRERYLSGNGDTFLGGISAVFYGSIPNNYFLWWQYLLLGQALATGLGLYFIFSHRVNFKGKLNLIVTVFLSYLILNLGVGQSRDGIMISGTVLLIGLLIRLPSSQFYILVPIFILTYSFRPWLAFAFFPVIFTALRLKIKASRLKAIMLSILIVIFPSVSEFTISDFWSIKSGFPQQAVMIHDLGSTYCLSSTQQSREIAYKALLKLAYSDESLDYFCNYYKPTTWQSTSSPNFTDPVLSLLPPPINTIKAGDQLAYKELEKSWVYLILSDPKTYIQNHLYFLTQVLVGGDSTSIEMDKFFGQFVETRNFDSLISFTGSIYNFPWKLIVMSYLLTPFFIYFAQVLFIFFRRKLTYVRFNFQFNMLFLFWIALTTFGFVSDNGRYTYLPALLVIGNWVYHLPKIRLN